VTVDRDVVGDDMSVLACGGHMQLIVLQILGWMISYAYQRPAIRPTRLPTDAFVDQVPLLFPTRERVRPYSKFYTKFHY